MQLAQGVVFDDVDGLVEGHRRFNGLADAVGVACCRGVQGWRAWRGWNTVHKPRGVGGLRREGAARRDAGGGFDDAVDQRRRQTPDADAVRVLVAAAHVVAEPQRGGAAAAAELGLARGGADGEQEVQLAPLHAGHLALEHVDDRAEGDGGFDFIADAVGVVGAGAVQGDAGDGRRRLRPRGVAGKRGGEDAKRDEDAVRGEDAVGGEMRWQFAQRKECAAGASGHGQPPCQRSRPQSALPAKCVAAASWCERFPSARRPESDASIAQCGVRGSAPRKRKHPMSGAPSREGDGRRYAVTLTVWVAVRPSSTSRAMPPLGRASSSALNTVSPSMAPVMRAPCTAISSW